MRKNGLRQNKVAREITTFSCYFVAYAVDFLVATQSRIITKL